MTTHAPNDILAAKLVALGHDLSNYTERAASIRAHLKDGWYNEHGAKRAAAALERYDKLIAYRIEAMRMLFTHTAPALTMHTDSVKAIEDVAVAYGEVISHGLAETIARITSGPTTIDDCIRELRQYGENLVDDNSKKPGITRAIEILNQLKATP